MIARFWDMLFDYADNAKAEGDRRKYEICHEIEDLLQKAYDDGLKHSNVIKTHKPKSKVEELVLSIPDIEVHKDKDDGQIWYELECLNRDYSSLRFDYPEEVIRFIIDHRTKQLSASMCAEREMLLTFISQRLRDLKCVESVLKRDGNKKVICDERRNK